MHFLQHEHVNYMLNILILLHTENSCGAFGRFWRFATSSLLLRKICKYSKYIIILYIYYYYTVYTLLYVTMYYILLLTLLALRTKNASADAQKCLGLAGPVVVQNGLGCLRLAGVVVVQNGLSVECGFASLRERGYAVMQIELQPQRQKRHHSAVLLEDEQRLLCRKGEIEPLTDRYATASRSSPLLIWV